MLHGMSHLLVFHHPVLVKVQQENIPRHEPALPGHVLGRHINHTDLTGHDDPTCPGQAVQNGGTAQSHHRSTLNTQLVSSETAIAIISLQQTATPLHFRWLHQQLCRHAARSLCQVIAPGHLSA